MGRYKDYMQEQLVDLPELQPERQSEDVIADYMDERAAQKVKLLKLVEGDYNEAY